MQRPIRLIRGAILFRGAGGSLTQRRHGHPTFTPQTVARNLEIRVRGQSPWALAATHGDPNQHGGTSRKSLHGRGSGSCCRHQHKPANKIPSHKKCRLKSHRVTEGQADTNGISEHPKVTGKWKAGVPSVSCVHISACAGTRVSYRSNQSVSMYGTYMVDMSQKLKSFCHPYPPSEKMGV